MSAGNSCNYNELSNSLALLVAYCAETCPPLIVVSCVFGTVEEGLKCIFDVSGRPSAAVMGPKLVELIEEYKHQGLTPSGAIRFLIPGVVIEQSDIRASVGNFIEIFDAVTDGTIVMDDEVIGVPMCECRLLDDDFTDEITNGEV